MKTKKHIMKNFEYRKEFAGIFFSYELEFNEYVDLINLNKKKIYEIMRDKIEKFKQLSKNDDYKKEYGDNYDLFLKDTVLSNFLSNHFSSIFTSIYFQFEAKMNELCDFLSYKNNIDFEKYKKKKKKKYINISLLDIQKMFLIQYAKIDFKEIEKYWEKIELYKSLRNYLVHSPNQYKIKKDNKLLVIPYLSNEPYTNGDEETKYKLFIENDKCLIDFIENIVLLFDKLLWIKKGE